MPPWLERRGSTLWIACALGLLTVALYFNSLPAPFAFDDIPAIRENPTLDSLRRALFPPGEGLTVSGRPLLNFSFALNRLAGAGTAGFRATNVALHVASGLLLFGLLRRTFSRPRLQPAYGSSAILLSAAICGLWLLHPLQTSAVTYIVQRAEALMAFFYLSTLYAFVRGIDSARGEMWRALSFTACLAGMATKEVMVSAPVIVALYDRWFVSAGWKEIWRQRKSYYLALASTWLLLAWLVAGTGGRGGSTGFSLGIGWTTYWATQFEAITRYFALGIWPAPLVFDYGVAWADRIADVLPYALVVSVFVLVLGRATIRGEPVAWLGIFVLALLAPTSLIPGGRQTIAEHRFYLPLAAVLTGLVILLHRFVGRRGLMLVVLTAAGLGALTFHRNTDYRSTLSLWADTVAKRPGNRWAQDNLGNALFEAGRADAALVHYEAALALDPTDAVHHYNSGNALARLDRVPEAIAHFNEAVRLAPNYLPAHNNLGNALCRVGRFDEALRHYSIVVRAQPDRASIRVNLGDALFRIGRNAEAISEFRAARQLQPDDANISYGLGCILLQTGSLADAAAEFQRTLSLSSTHAEAAANLGSAFAQLGRIEDAMRALREAVRLNPANPEPHNNLGAIYAHVGRVDEAIAEFGETLRLAPDHATARQSLRRLQERSRAP